jgi:hypothetical protein
MKELKLDKISPVKLVNYSEKMVKQEYIENAKIAMGDNPKSLLMALNSLPKGNELEDAAEAWRESLNGVVKTLEYALKELNPEAKETDIQEYICKLEAEDLVNAVKAVYGVEEVENKKK